jgi:DNA replication and repair protein RecF
VRIDRLVTERFRNLDAVVLRPHARFTIFEGANGQGKSNLLEAIAVLANLRSFRSSKLGDCVAFGQDSAQVGGRVHGRGVTLDLGVEIAGGRSRVFVDGKPVRRTSEALGSLVAVLFSAVDLGLPIGEPSARRRWLDRAIYHHHPLYLQELRRYDKALASRNALLRDADRGRLDERALDAFDAQCAAAGGVISARRQAFCLSLSERVAAEFAAFAAPGLRAALAYAPQDSTWNSALSPSARGERLAEQLRASRKVDLRRGTTTVGPQRDDVAMLLDGRLAREHASQGQCRALVLALKTAEIRSLEETLGEPPVLLMDDVSSELDRERNAALMHHLDAFGGQVFLTTTDASYIQLTAPRDVVHVAGGRLT